MTHRLRRIYDATQAYTITVETPEGVDDEAVTQVLSGLSLAPGMTITAREVGEDLVPEGWEVSCSDGELDSAPILSDTESIEVETPTTLVLRDYLNGRYNTWRVVLLRPGDRYGRNDRLTATRPKVEFWDLSADKTKFPLGQFVTRYWLETLLHVRGDGGQFILSGEVPEWRLTGAAMEHVVNWLHGQLMTAVMKHWSQEAP